MSAVCPVCGAEQSQSLLCSSCCDKIERELSSVPGLVEDLQITMSKQAKIGNGGKAGKGSTHEKWPINMGAVEAADNLGNVLTTWARDLLETSGGRWDLLLAASTAHPTTVSRALLLMIPTIRRHPAVVELVDEITDAIAQARRAVDRPADRQYLGQCLMETPDDEGRQVTCLAELYARVNANDVTCKVCGAEHPVGERRAWLLARAADMIVTVKEASSYLGEVGGIKVSQSSIRGYLHRGRLAYRPGVANGIRLGDLLTLLVDESEKRQPASVSVA